MIWLLRMVRLVRNPPSEGRIKLVLGVIALVLVLFAIERLVGWPEALTLDPVNRRGF